MHVTTGASAPVLDPAHYRAVLGHFVTGVTVVSAIHRGQPVGFAVNSFSSVSLSPPLVCFCAGKSSDTWMRIRETGAFCVNILAEGQADLTRAFARKGADRFTGVPWAPAPVTGSPRLPDTVGWIDCTVESVVDAGDHELVVGRVRGLDVDLRVPPLAFFRGDFVRLAAGTSRPEPVGP